MIVLCVVLLSSCGNVMLVVVLLLVLSCYCRFAIADVGMRCVMVIVFVL